MSALEAPACTQGIGDETLASWRDGFLADAGEAQRLRAHTPTCAGCQWRLAALESVATALRRQYTPEPHPALWRRIEARLESPVRGQFFGIGAHRFSAGAVWGALGAVAVVLLITASFLSLFSTTRPSSGLTATTLRQANETATAALTWRAGSLPAEFSMQPQQPTLAVAPSDGRLAYTCLLSPVTGGARPAVWRSEDRAATWTRIGALPITRSDLLSCALLLDEGEPAIAVASVTYGAFYAGAPDHTAHFATYDRGLNWEPIADAEGTAYQRLITWQKIKFTLRDIEPRNQPDDTHLATSVDNMATWQDIDAPLKARGLRVTDFWLDDRTGALIALAGASKDSSPLQIWRSTDQGATWTQIADQQASFSVYNGGFARPSGSWSFCAITPDDQPPFTARCATEGGKTWSRYRRAISQTSSAALPDELRNLIWQVVFMPNDGAFILSVMGADRVLTLLRLDPVGGTWKTLGQTPAVLLRYATDAHTGEGVLWAIPAGGAPGAWQATVQTATTAS